MAAVSTLVSVEDYIQTYINEGKKPVCEYVDGVLIPKASGNLKHGRTQYRLMLLINEGLPQFEAVSELHARLRRDQFYVPDVAVGVRGGWKGDYPGPDSPCYLCIEIVSPGQGVGMFLAKCEEYHRWGVTYCWVIDPERRTAWEYARGTEPRHVTEQETLRAGEIEIQLSEVLPVLS